jgi:dihydropteroate synthase
LSESVDIIDIGASSTRPGSPISHPDDEIKSLIPIIDYISKNHSSTFISVDTYHSSVAEASLQAGAQIINDISGGIV